MGSRIKSFLFGKASSSNRDNRQNLPSQPYDAAVPRDAPLRGSQPVSGNGPPVLGNLRRGRLKRQSISTPSAAAAPSVPRHRGQDHPSTGDTADTNTNTGDTERPKTAPHHAARPSGGAAGDGGAAGGRPRSGFSMKSPPAFLDPSKRRRSSVASTRSRRNSLWAIGTTTEEPPPPLPTAISPAAELQAGAYPPPEPFTPPFARQHARNSSGASHKSYIDILDAHSSINGSREASRHRAKASGLRNYGEDVADRNITQFGEKGDKGEKGERPEKGEKCKRGKRGTRDLDLDSPEFSYLKHIYSPEGGQNVPRVDGSAEKSHRENHDAVDADVHVLARGGGPGSGSGDDMRAPTISTTTPSLPALQTAPPPKSTTPPPPSSPRISSIRSFTAPRPGIVYPPRTDSFRSHHSAFASRSDDDPLATSNGLQDRDDRTLSIAPRSSAASIHERGAPQSPQDHQHQSTRPARTRAVSTPAIITDRGRQRSTSLASASASLKNTSDNHPIPPLPTTLPSSPRSSPPSSQSDMVFGFGSRKKKRSSASKTTTTAAPRVPSSSGGSSSTSNGYTSARSERSVAANGGTQPSTHGRTTSSSGNQPVLTSSNAASESPPLPSAARVESRASDSVGPNAPSVPTSNGNPRKGVIVDRASEPPDLKGVVDLKDSVDTDVTTKTLPAVIHEHITPTQHQIREERTTREIHTHEVYHRVLPVIETEILPTKHYLRAEDGKTLIEIPESDVPKYAVSGREAHNWHIAPGPGPCRPTNSADSVDPSEMDSADSPVIGLARGEPNSRSRRNSTRSSKSSGSRRKTFLEPILTSKKEYMTKEGYPRTEYVWHHPPVFETADGKTSPIYVGAGIGDLSRHIYSSDDYEDGGESSTANQESDLLFKNLGYGGSGMLPGLRDKSPVAEWCTPDADNAVDNDHDLYEDDVKTTRYPAGPANGKGIDGMVQGMRNMKVK